VPTIDELAPQYVREKKLDLSTDPDAEAPRANRSILVTVNYGRTAPDGVSLPLVMEIQGPSPTSYQRRVFSRTRPASVIFTPREGGRHDVILREAAHNRWWGSLALEVAGEPAV
jgi:hypothetical protein